MMTKIFPKLIQIPQFLALTTKDIDRVNSN